jgi:hypothetical protein
MLKDLSLNKLNAVGLHWKICNPALDFRELTSIMISSLLKKALGPFRIKRRCQIRQITRNPRWYHAPICWGKLAAYGNFRQWFTVDRLRKGFTNTDIIEWWSADIKSKIESAQDGSRDVIISMGLARPILVPLALLTVAVVLRLVDILLLPLAEATGEAFLHKALGF